MKARKSSKLYQYVISILLVLAVTSGCYVLGSSLDHEAVALVLLVTVSFLAIVFDIFPVLIAALFSALILNFFFIQPIHTLHVRTSEDLLLLAIYLVVALVNAVLTFKIRKAEKKAREREERENSIKLYNTLFNSLSHELKTPISTIIGAVDTLKEYSSNLSGKHREELLSEIGKAGVRLNKQVENLLSMSRLESGMLKLNLDWSDLSELIHSVILKFPDNPGRIVFPEADDLPLYKLDAGLLEQVIFNLVHNAMIYTPEDAVITITIEDLPDTLKIRVSDNGAGFPEEEIAHVFDKFYRLPDARSGGTGLGLSIARGFTEAHAGTIVLENQPSGGACFTIEIPCEKSYINHLKNE